MDVDGVISLFGFDPARPPDGRFQLVDGIAHLISATAGEHLRHLGTEFEMVWCTGWEEKANDYLVQELGLPEPVPYLRFDHEVRIVGAHWKLAAIERYAGPDRALAWVDDAHTDDCVRWATARRGPTRLVSTDPATGLTQDQVAELLAWARLLV